MEESNLINIAPLKLSNDDPKSELQEPLEAFGINLHDTIKQLTLQFTPIARSLLLSGDWGSGKTSVLLYIQEALKKTDFIEVVFFDAWKYEDEQNLMQSLLWQIVKQSPRYKTFKKKYKSSKQNIIHQLLTLLLKKVTRTSFIDLDKNTKYLKHKELQALTSRNLAETNPTDKFIEAFHQLKNELFPKKKLLFIIDDLDRCSPESGMNLLDNIRQIIHNTHTTTVECMFIVAMDKSTLLSAIHHKFADFSDYDSNRYLEKLFPLTFNLPQANIYLSSVNEYHQLNDETRKQISQIFSQTPFSNTRLLKRCLNQLYLFGKSSKETNIHPGLLEWIAAINRWPELRRCINIKGNAFWDRVAEKLLNNADTQKQHVEDESINRLLAQPNIKEFLRSSTIFGSIYNETSLAERVVTYKEYEKQLKQVGL